MMPLPKAALPPAPQPETETERLAERLKLADGAGFLARVLNARVTSLFEELTGQTDITAQQFGALLTLHQRGRLTLTELAVAIRVDRSTLSEMTRRMVARALIERHPHDEDGRSAMLSLAPAGRAAVLRLVRGAAAMQDALLAPLPREERRLFLRQLKLVALDPPVTQREVRRTAGR